MSKAIIAAVDDIFFASKIRAAAEHLGLKVRFACSLEEAVEAARREPHALIIADLHSQKCDPFALAGRIKADDALRAVSLLGFFSHVQTELQQRALAAGFDRVMPRSAFSKNLAEILKNAGEAGSEV